MVAGAWRLHPNGNAQTVTNMVIKNLSRDIV
jgi:hypothetical protein